MMGWIASRAYRIGHGPVNSPSRVEEPAGFDGERVTPAGQIVTKAWPAFTIPRDGRTVYATKREAARSLTDHIR